MWDIPESYSDKRLWLEKYYGDLAKKRLILTNRKDLAIGDFLVDDRLKNGSEKFKGKFIHFGTGAFPDWKAVSSFLNTQ
jgi:5'(3')-deoxyribonucleotidase